MSGRKQQARLSHADFYTLCEWLKRPGQLSEETTLVLLAAKASTDMGRPITATSVADALSSTRLRYIPTAQSRSANKLGAESGQDTLSLARAVERLYQRLGEPVPMDIVLLVERLKK